MKIHFERTGGFAGLRLAVSIDTETLPPDQARELHDLVTAAGFFDLPGRIESPAPGADQFHYKLSVEDGARRHTVEVSDAAAPASLRPLLRRLTVLARSPGRP